MKSFHKLASPFTKRPWLGLLIVGLLLGFAFQGSRGLWSTDEGRYTDGALQMLDSGNYLIPAYNADRINLAKPPVIYWAIAGSMKVFGRNTWAVRTPYAIAFVLTILLLYAIGRTLLPVKPWLPGLIYACAAVPFFAANIVSTDTLLTLFEALAALGFVRLAFGNRRPAQWLDAILMWLGLGLAFLTKGPPGLILLLATIPFVIVRDGWRGLGRLFQPPGIIVFLVVALTWFGLVVLTEPQALHNFLHREIYERLFTGAQHRHPGPFGWAIVYLPTLIVGTLPWWPILFRNWRRRFITQGRTPWLRGHPEEFFLLLWLLLPLLVFCLAQSRLPLYVLPLFLPVSLLLAFALQDDIDLVRPRQCILIGVWMIALLVLKAGVAYRAHPAADNRLAAEQIASMARPASYDAVIFVGNTAESSVVQEQTPWGVRLYLGKPVYAVAWAAPQSVEKLCRAVHAHRSSLLLFAGATKVQAEDAVAARCPVQAFSHAGTWRHHQLMLIKT